MTEQKKPEAEKSWLQAIRETIYGMAAHDMSRAALRTRSSMEHLFILITMGDLLGVPILPPYYSLRLLALCRAANRHVETAHVAREGRRGRDVLGGSDGT